MRDPPPNRPRSALLLLGATFWGIPINNFINALKILKAGLVYTSNELKRGIKNES